MKKVLAIALLSSIAGMQAMDMSKINAMMMDNGMMKKCMEMCMVPAALCVAQMMCKEKEGCPMKRGVTDSSNTLADVTNKLADGSIQAALQRVFSPLGQAYSNDWQSVATDTVVNAAVTEADARLGISSLHPKLQALVSTSTGKLAFVTVLNALAKAAYSYAVNQLPAAAAPVAKK